MSSYIDALSLPYYFPLSLPINHQTQNINNYNYNNNKNGPPTKPNNTPQTASGLPPPHTLPLRLLCHFNTAVPAPDISTLVLYNRRLGPLPGHAPDHNRRRDHHPSARKDTILRGTREHWTGVCSGGEMRDWIGASFFDGEWEWKYAAWDRDRWHGKKRRATTITITINPHIQHGNPLTVFNRQPWGSTRRGGDHR